VSYLLYLRRYYIKFTIFNIINLKWLKRGENMKKYDDNFTHIKDVKPFPDTCGEIYELAAAPEISLAYVKLTGTGKAHRHNIMQELYYITDGIGYITIDGEKHKLTKGQSVVIPKQKDHFIEAEPGNILEILVATTPKFTVDDVIEVSN